MFIFYCYIWFYVVSWNLEVFSCEFSGYFFLCAFVLLILYVIILSFMTFNVNFSFVYPVNFGFVVPVNFIVWITLNCHSQLTNLTFDSHILSEPNKIACPEPPSLPPHTLALFPSSSHPLPMPVRLSNFFSVLSFDFILSYET